MISVIIIAATLCAEKAMASEATTWQQQPSGFISANNLWMPSKAEAYPFHTVWMGMEEEEGVKPMCNNASTPCF